MKKFFNLFKDFFIVAKEIENYEIFIRTLTCPKHMSEDGSIPDRKLKEYFLPNKGGVSINRYRFTNENKQKIRGKKFEGYRGFAIFNVDIFEQALLRYNNPDFLPKIKSSPLNKDGEYITIKRIFTYIPGDLSHADILYPEITPENPNIPLRVFSKILAEMCIKLIDDDIENNEWTGDKFSKSISDYYHK